MVKDPEPLKWLSDLICTFVVDDDDEGPLTGINWMKILQQIDNALLKYDFDTAACAKVSFFW